jgi:hypothetical protein
VQILCEAADRALEEKAVVLGPGIDMKPFCMTACGFDGTTKTSLLFSCTICDAKNTSRHKIELLAARKCLG